MDTAQTDTKQCTICGCNKSLDEFYQRKASADGHIARCKACVKADYEQNKDKVKEYYKKNREKIIARSREYRKKNKNRRRKNESTRAKHRAVTNEYKKNNPIKVKAQSAVFMAVLQGRLPRAHTVLCSTCGQSASEYHHWSYEHEHWLDVVPLCHSCHMKIHRGSAENN